MPQAENIEKRNWNAGASFVKQVHCINRLVICHIRTPILIRYVSRLAFLFYAPKASDYGFFRICVSACADKRSCEKSLSLQNNACFDIPSLTICPLLCSHLEVCSFWALGVFTIADDRVHNEIFHNAKESSPHPALHGEQCFL